MPVRISGPLVIANTRESQKKEPLDGRPIAIALDTKGPEIRTGVLVGDDPVLEKGAKLTVHTDDAMKEKCDAANLWMDYKNLPKVMSVGGFIFVDDGLISLRVDGIDAAAGTLDCTIMNSGKLGSRKGCNLPEVDVDLPALSEKDKADLTWGVGQGVDMIFASFIRKASDVQEVRDCLVAADPVHGARVMIISKIENHEGMRNFDEILEVTDGVMVARGDLGIEIPAQKVFREQKDMISKCRRAGKPCVVATQMLESMIVNPRPTRAECSDVANAVLDGADCVMLSGETANGKFPTAAVEIMARTCLEAEAMARAQDPSGYDGIFKLMKTSKKGHKLSHVESAASSAVKTACDIDAKAIIVLSETGETARYVAKFHPDAPIVAVMVDSRIGRQIQGAMYNAVALPTSLKRGDGSHVKLAFDEGKKMGIYKDGDAVVCVHTTRNSEGVKQFMVRILFVTSGDPNLQTSATGGMGPGAKRSRVS